MIDIAAKMRELIPLLKTQGVMGVPLPDVQPEREEEWSADYAIIRCVYYLDQLDFVPGFDDLEFDYHLGLLVREHFSSDGEVAVVVRQWPWRYARLNPNTVVINLRLESQEIEVYRHRE